MNCWNTLRAMKTTTRPETANVMVQKRHGLGNQQRSTCNGDRSTTIPPGSRRKRAEASGTLPRRGGDDMVCSVGKPAAGASSDRTDNRRLYVSNYGELDVVLDRNQDDCYLLLDFNYLATPVLRTTRDWPIAKTGDSDKRQILRESSYAVLNAKAHGMVDAIPTTLAAG